MERTSRVVEWTGLQWSGRSRFGADGIQGKMAGWRIPGGKDGGVAERVENHVLRSLALLFSPLPPSQSTRVVRTCDCSPNPRRTPPGQAEHPWRLGAQLPHRLGGVPHPRRTGAPPLQAEQSVTAEQKRRSSTWHTTDREEKHATEGSAWSGRASVPESHSNRGSTVLVPPSRAATAGKLAFAGEGLEGG